MSQKLERELDRLAKQRKRERKRVLEERLAMEIRRDAPKNAALWLLVVGGSFVLNVLVLLALAKT